MPSDEIIWGDWTGVDLVRRLYHWLAIEVWSCHKIADHLNNLGVPTAYTKDGRLVKVGERKERTQGKWRAGRIRNIVVQPVYKGEAALWPPHHQNGRAKGHHLRGSRPSSKGDMGSRPKDTVGEPTYGQEHQTVLLA